MLRFRQIISGMLVMLSAFLLTGCKLAVLEPKGLVAADEKGIFYLAILLMLIIVVPVIAITFFFAWRYHEKNTKANYQPEWAHNNWIEVICWGVPCIIIAILASITWASSHRLDPYRPLDMSGKPLTIQVIALEWKWLFIYPEQNIASVNYVKMPVNKQVKFLITSEGPMDSFQIPQLAGQIYAMAGMQTKLHIRADEVGDYRGMSTSFSGDGFSGMKFTASVVTQKEFNQWVKHIKQSPNRLTEKEYNKLLKPSANVKPIFYSKADRQIYHHSIMKYMMPTKNR